MKLICVRLIHTKCIISYTRTRRRSRLHTSSECLLGKSWTDWTLFYLSSSHAEDKPV